MLGRFTGLLLLAVMVFQLGCGPSSTKLLGTWRMEGADQLVEMMGGLPKPEGIAGSLLSSAIAAMAEKTDANAEVEFLSNGSLQTRMSLAGNKTEKSGKWKLISVEGDTYRLWCQLGEEDPVEIEVTMLDEDTAEMVPPNIAILKRKFKFQRVKP